MASFVVKLLRLVDTWITPHEQDGDILRLVCFVFFLSFLISRQSLPLAATLFSAETPELFRELKIFTSAQG